MSDDLETRQLDDLTVTGAWRLLCISLLHDATQRIVQSRNLWRQSRGVSGFNDRGWRSQQKEHCEAAERWIKGGVGVVTFEDCCSLMEITPEIARKKIEEYAHGRRREKPAKVSW